MHKIMDDDVFAAILKQAEEFDKRIVPSTISNLIPPPSEATLREIGLQVPINEENKGFQMLRKMNGNWKPGMPLGNKKGGIVEPIEIQVDSIQSRQGLGTKRPKLMQSVLTLGNVAKEEEYLMNLARDNRARLLLLDLRNSAQTILTLEEQAKSRKDSSKRALEKEEAILLPEFDICQEIFDDSMSLEEISEALESRIFYLRSKYCYCLYCGDKYDSFETLELECPGPYDRDH